jgi:predicted transcriptional regulator
MEDTVFALLLRTLAEQKQHLMEYLASGGAKSYEDYCRVTGEFAAVQRLSDDIKALEKRFIAD